MRNLWLITEAVDESDKLLELLEDGWEPYGYDVPTYSSTVNGKVIKWVHLRKNAGDKLSEEEFAFEQKRIWKEGV